MASEFYKLPPEDRILPEDSAPAPEDILPGTTTPDEGSSQIRERSLRERLKKLVFIPAAATLSALSIVLASLGSDPLGMDFLNAPAVSPPASTATSASSPSAVVPSVTSAAPSSASSVVRKSSVSIPFPEGKVTYDYTVTYAPTGETYNAQRMSEPDMYADACAWITGRGGDPSSLVLYDYDLSYTGIEKSDDAIIIGDLDDFDNLYILRGTVYKTYILKVWYEGYAY